LHCLSDLTGIVQALSFDLQTATMTPLPVITLDKILDYATLKNLVYVSGGIIILEAGRWLYWPIRKLFSPLRHLPGPRNESLIFGNLRRIFAAQNSVVHEAWAEKHGPTYVYRGFLSVSD
jgi:hypothetical protein